MRAPTVRVPKLRLHKPSGQDVVTIKGRDFYPGPYGSEACLAEYKRLIAELLTCGRWVDSPSRSSGTSDLTLNELILPYVGHADVYYRKNGQPTTEPAYIGSPSDLSASFMGTRSSKILAR